LLLPLLRAPASVCPSVLVRPGRQPSTWAGAVLMLTRPTPGEPPRLVVRSCVNIRPNSDALMPESVKNRPRFHVGGAPVVTHLVAADVDATEPKPVMHKEST